MVRKPVELFNVVRRIILAGTGSHDTEARCCGGWVFTRWRFALCCEEIFRVDWLKPLIQSLIFLTA